MRLTFADEPKKESPLDVQAALVMWRKINSNPRKWATFEATQAGVKVDWGSKHYNGMKERAIQTIHYSLGKLGALHVKLSTHS